MSLLKQVGVKLQKAWLLVPEPNSRSYVLFTTFVSLVLGSLVAVLVTTFEGTQSRIEAQRTEFLNEANALDDKVMAYLYLVDNNKSVSGEPTENIVANLIHQYHMIDNVVLKLKKQDRHMVSDYKKQLVRFRQDLPEDTSVLHMQSFVNDFRSIALTQEELRKKLKN